MSKLLNRRENYPLAFLRGSRPACNEAVTNEGFALGKHMLFEVLHQA